MPIIPSNWTGSVAVNAIGIGGSSGSTSYAYANSLNATITELDTFIDIVGVCDEPISREVSLDLISGKVKLYWKGLDDTYTQIHKDDLIFNTGYNFVDLTLGQLGLSIKCSELTEISLVLRWDKDIEFDLYSSNGGDLMIPVNVRLALGTGINYVDIANTHGIYDDGAEVYDEYQNNINQGSISTYQSNLRQLKDSDSIPRATGYKLFDIECFYPGKVIDFNVVVEPFSRYGTIHVQLFDPLTVGEVLFAIANDVVNLDVGDLSVNFVGSLTRNAWYKNVISNKVAIKPNFSHHIGRFVAQNLDNNNAFDTCIIKSYTPNTSPLLGGTFTLTGKF